MKYFRFIFLFIFASTLILSCDDDSNFQPIDGLPSTLNLLKNSEEHEIFYNLISANNLDELLNSDTYTIFAPVDAAFNEINLDELTPSEIEDLIRYHIIQGNAQSGDLSNTYLTTQSKTSIDGNEVNLSMLVNLQEAIFLNGNSQVIEADLEASNGTIHIVDQVIDLPNLETFVSNDANLSSLLAALTREDQPDYLATLGTNPNNNLAPITLLAPSNEAFAAAIILLGLEDLNQIDAATLTETLNLHLITNANLREVDFTEETLETLGGNLSFNTEADLIIDLNGREINFETRNVQAKNGVLHVLEDVILPESDLEEPGEDDDINFTLENELNLAYFVSEIEGVANVTNIGENNSTWTLNVGSRYNINVVNAASHPLEFRNDANETLLAQPETIEGSFENDEAVNFTVEGTIFSFTLTQELANQLSSYFCSNHPAMNGSIIVN